MCTNFRAVKTGPRTTQNINELVLVGNRCMLRVTRVETLCQAGAVTSQDDRVYADRNDCRSYFYCFAGQVHRATCSAGLHFHGDLQSCHEQRPRHCRTRRQRLG